MAKKQALTITLRIEGVRETLAALKKLPKDASQELKDRSKEIAETLAVRARAAATSEGRQAALMAKTVKVRRDRLPVVQAGGPTKVGRFRVPAYALLFGSEFGMNARSGWYANPRFKGSPGRQFKPHVGRGSYWFFKSVEDMQEEIASQWRQAADDVVRKFGEGG